MSRSVISIAIALAIGLGAAGHVHCAYAQAAPMVGAGHDRAHAEPPPRAQEFQRKPHLGVAHPHGDISESNGKAMAVLFWIFAVVCVGGALFVITRRNLVAAVMGMVGSFVGIAAVYMMLYAPFLAVIQMLVYAGAIMVLFVFVIMILNRPEDEPVAPSGRVGQVVGGVAIVYLIAKLAMMFTHMEMPTQAAALAAPANIQLPAIQLGGTGESVGWGTLKAVGFDLFGPGLFPFEAISILLLIAVVGAIAIARPLRSDDSTGTTP